MSEGSHRDYALSESVNVLSGGQVLLTLEDSGVRGSVADLVWAAGLFVRGEVLADSRGEGSQQRRDG